MATQASCSPSPSSLLGIYQLKREHGSLATRMSKLEATIEQLSRQLQSADAKMEQVSRQAQSAVEAVESHATAIETRLRALAAANDGHETGLAEFRTEILQRMQDMKADVGALAATASRMGSDRPRVDGQLKRSNVEQHKFVLRRVAEFENHLFEHEDSLTALGRVVNDTAARTIRDWLSGLRADVEAARVFSFEVAELRDKLSVVESGIATFEERNAQLAIEMKNIKTEHADTVQSAHLRRELPASPPASAGQAAVNGEVQQMILSGSNESLREVSNGGRHIPPHLGTVLTAQDQAHVTSEADRPLHHSANADHDLLDSKETQDSEQNTLEVEDNATVQKINLPPRNSRGLFQRAEPVGVNVTVRARENCGRSSEAISEQEHEVSASPEGRDGAQRVSRSEQRQQRSERPGKGLTMTTRSQGKLVSPRNQENQNLRSREIATRFKKHAQGPQRRELTAVEDVYDFGSTSTLSPRVQTSYWSHKIQGDLFNSETDDNDEEHAAHVYDNAQHTRPKQQQEQQPPSKRRRYASKQDSDDEQLLRKIKMDEFVNLSPSQHAV